MENGINNQRRTIKKILKSMRTKRKIKYGKESLNIKEKQKKKKLNPYKTIYERRDNFFLSV